MAKEGIGFKIGRLRKDTLYSSNVFTNTIGYKPKVLDRVKKKISETIHQPNAFEKFLKVIKIGKVCLTINCILTIFICIICNLVINHELTWSLVVLASVIFGWILIVSISPGKPNAMKRFLLIFSFSLIFYLLNLRSLLKIPLIATMGIPICVLSLSFIWSIYFVFHKFFKNRTSLTIGLTFFIISILSIGIEFIITCNVSEYHLDTISNLIKMLVFFSLGSFFIGLDFNRPKEEKIEELDDDFEEYIC